MNTEPTPREVLTELWEVLPPEVRDDHDSLQLWEKVGREWTQYFPTNPFATEDVYAIMAEYRKARPYSETANPDTRPVAFAVRTAGWGIGVDTANRAPDTAPSQSPERIRCALTVVVTVMGCASRCDMGEPMNEVLIVDGPEQSAGGLAFALDETAVAVFGAEYSARLISELVALRPSMNDDQRAHSLRRVAEIIGRTKAWKDYAKGQDDTAPDGRPMRTAAIYSLGSPLGPGRGTLGTSGE